MIRNDVNVWYNQFMRMIFIHLNIWKFIEIGKNKMGVHGIKFQNHVNFLGLERGSGPSFVPARLGQFMHGTPLARSRKEIV